ncbi:MAG: radical SAM protein [Candidatus Aenigmatarchaeota archaeon]
MAKLLFIQPEFFIAFGQMYISSLLKLNNHKTEIIIESLEDNITKKINKSKPDLIGIYTPTIFVNWALNTAKKIKENFDIPIILGGPHPTIFPYIVKEKCIDMICRGEGEYAMLELMDKIERGEETNRIKNLWIKKDGKIFSNKLRPLISNLDEIPFPDRELYYKKFKFLKKSTIQRFLTGRGCPFSCSYCFNHQFKKLYRNKGKYVRRRSVENVLEEIKIVKEKYRPKIVSFDDDTFILDFKWFNHFVREYKREIDIPYVCNVRPDLINEKIVKLLKSSGCLGVRFGIETADEKLRYVLKRYITNSQILSAVRLFKKYNLKFMSFNMIALPNESLEDAFKTLEFNARLKPAVASPSATLVFPGTELMKYCIRQNIIPKNNIEEAKNSVVSLIKFHPNFNELLNLICFYNLGVKLPFITPFLKKLVFLPTNTFFFQFGSLFFNFLSAKYYNMSIKECIRFLKNIITKEKKLSHPSARFYIDKI